MQDTNLTDKSPHFSNYLIKMLSLSEESSVYQLHMIL
jgi:hypothetical protein